MNPLRIAIFLTLVLALLAGCKPRSKQITELQRKEAAHIDSEAQFAVTMRQWDRAEGLYAKAAQVCPDTGQYWLNLGATRMRLGKRDTAKDAYKSALKAFEAEAAERKEDVEPWLGQIKVLALLGRADDSRAALEKAAKRFPNDRMLRVMREGKNFDQMLADPAFKQDAL
jgi:tetratricopeptide (TPR) repeat protein